MAQTTGPGLAVQDSLHTPVRQAPDRPVPGPTRGRLAALRYPEVAVGVLAVAMFSWRAGAPSAWWDEAITRDVVSRPLPAILDLVGRVDLVHAAYYLLVHALLGSDASVGQIRALSVVAAAATAVLLVRVGRELGSTRVGLVAGLAFPVAPLVSRYAQEARPYALVTLVVTAATLALIRACQSPPSARRWVLYGVLLALVGLSNLLALFILPVHLLQALATRSAAVRRRWALAAGTALVSLGPFLVMSMRQSEQVSWLPRPDHEQLQGFLSAEYACTLPLVALLVLALAGLSLGVRGTFPPALGLGLAWSLLPPLLLWTISQAHPLFDWRYVVFSLPGTALAIGSLATLLRVRWTALLLSALLVIGWHMQVVYRLPATGHAEDIRGAAAVIGAGSRPGDAVIFLPSSRRVVELGYPEDFDGVDDVALARNPQESGTLWGVELPTQRIAARLYRHDRVWVVTGPPRLGEGAAPDEVEKEQLLTSGFRLDQVTDTARYQVRLYVRLIGIVPAR